MAQGRGSRRESKMNRFAAYGGWGAEYDGEQTGEENEEICCIKSEGRRAEGADGRSI